MTGSLAPSLRLQSTIVHALIMQDMNKRYSQSRLGALMAIIEPMLMVLGLYFIRFYVQGITVMRGVPLLLFILTGYMLYFTFRHMVNAVTTATERKASSQMFPQVTSMDAIAAQIITSIIINGGVMFATFTLGYLYSGNAPRDVLLVVLAGLLMLTLGAPVGILFGVIVRYFPAFKLALALILRLNLIISGAFFTADEVPAKILPFVGWNPCFHIIELMREAWFPSYVSPIASPYFIVMSLIGLTASALVAERATSKFKYS